MKKKLIALAVAGAFAPALALADSNVTIYGRLNMDFEQVQAGGSTTPAADIPGRNRVSSNSSRIGFKGTEDLGAGLKAWFQVEQGITADATGVGGRNTGVGLSGAFGSVHLGFWDTPYRAAPSPTIRSLPPVSPLIPASWATPRYPPSTRPLPPALTVGKATRCNTDAGFPGLQRQDRL